jgi:7-carboxy-7-deazaguanine synthase
LQTNRLDTLPVMESFYTIQGEGYYQGHAAYFIRLGGCDVGCHWCDVKDSWDASVHPQIPLDTLVDTASSFAAKLCVITGGEPAMHDLSLLTQRLKAKGNRTHIETSGVYRLTGEWDWICVSPKKFKPALPEVLMQAHELKIIIFHSSDLDWAESFREKVSPTCKLYLQPEWSRCEELLPQIISFIQENPHWEISLQLHKYMNIP